MSVDEGSLLLGTDSLQLVDTLHLPLETVDKLEAVQLTEIDSTLEDGSYGENDKGVTPTGSVTESVNSLALNEVLVQKSTFTSDAIFSSQEVTILREWEGSYSFVVVISVIYLIAGSFRRIYL